MCFLKNIITRLVCLIRWEFDRGIVTRRRGLVNSVNHQYLRPATLQTRELLVRLILKGALGLVKNNSVYFSFLPAAGNRNNSNGQLNNRGNNGYYWSSTYNSTTNGYNLNFNSGSTNINNNNRSNGFSVRCVAEFILNNN